MSEFTGHGFTIVKNFGSEEDGLRAPFQYPYEKPQYIPNNDRSITISDPVWGTEQLMPEEGDGIWWRLYHHPVVIRTLGIEQLTLPPEYSMIPGSGDFPRWEHVWGSVVLTRKLIRKWEQDNGTVLDDKAKLILQLRTFVSDLAHTAGSHLGDWMFQGFNGTEDAHDEDLEEFLIKTGISNVLELSGINVKEVVFPDIKDFVERPGPELCIDRLDYLVRQINGRFLGHAALSLTVSSKWVDSGIIKLNEDMSHIIMTDSGIAANLGRAASLLATEHFSHPVHLTILQLYAELFRYAITRNDVGYIGELGMTGGIGLHPRDSMYMTDSQIIKAMIAYVGPANQVLPELVDSIAESQRRVFSGKAWGALGTLAANGGTFPMPLDGEGVGSLMLDIGMLDSFIKDGSTDVLDMISGKEYTLKGLKPRYIDPLVAVGESEPVNLSVMDKDFGRWLDGYRQVSAAQYTGRLGITNSVLAATIKAEIIEARKIWEERLGLTRLNSEQFSGPMGIISQAARSALYHCADYGSRVVGFDQGSISATYL